MDHAAGTLHSSVWMFNKLITFLFPHLATHFYYIRCSEKMLILQRRHKADSKAMEEEGTKDNVSY